MTRKRVAVLSSLFLITVCGAGGALWVRMTRPPPAPEKPLVVGAVEQVVLLPWGLRVPARIDTGAARSSLDARDIRVLKKERGKDQEVEFKLPDKYGGYAARRKIVTWQGTRSSDGGLEKRPVVELDLIIGPKHLTTQVTLNDRSKMEFPLLVGRNTLHKVFVVDVERENMLPPVWAGGPAATREATTRPEARGQ